MKLLIILLTSTICLSGCSPAFAETYPANLWKGILAEAADQGYKGQYAVACCVRNRLKAGMNTGLVALKRKDLDAFIKREVDYGLRKGINYELMAKDIIRKVFNENAPDVTFGATHYEAVDKYGWPKWTKDMVCTVKIGGHYFFKKKGGKK